MPSPTALRIVILACALVGAAGCESSSRAARDGSMEDGGVHDGHVPDDRDDAGDLEDAALSDGGADGGMLEDPDGGADGGDLGEALALTPYCEETAALYYEYLQSCYGADPYPEAERAERVERYRARCMQVEPAIDDGRVAFDEHQASACAASLRAADCASNFVSPMCEGVFHGLVEPGGDCYVEETLIFLVGVSACVDGRCVEDNACPGSCEALPARGEDCADGICRVDDYCDAEGTCRERKEAGEPCAESFECGTDMHCIDVDGEQRCTRPVRTEGGACDVSMPCGGLTLCLDGQCTYARPLGESCVVDPQCEDEAACVQGECVVPGEVGDPCSVDRHCEAPLLCDTAALEATCVPAPSDGELCIRNQCAAGTSCRYDFDDGAGTCRDQVGQGESCLVGTIPSDDRCEADLHCVEDGTCEAPGDIGDPCGVFSSGGCIDGLWCSRETRTCQEPAAQGEACNPSWRSTCEAGLGCACGIEDTLMCGSHPRAPVATDTCQPLVDSEGACFRAIECANGTCIIDFDGPSDIAGSCDDEQPLCLP